MPPPTQPSQTNSKRAVPPPSAHPFLQRSAAMLDSEAAINATFRLFDLRVVPSSGLLYVGAVPSVVTLGSKHASGTAAPLVTSGLWRATAAPLPVQPAAGTAAANAAPVRSRGTATGISRAATGSLSAAAASSSPKIKSSDWRKIRSLQKYPYTAIGLIEMTTGPFQAACRWA
jgi:hypothetical protein